MSCVKENRRDQNISEQWEENRAQRRRLAQKRPLGKNTARNFTYGCAPFANILSSYALMLCTHSSALSRKLYSSYHFLCICRASFLSLFNCFRHQGYCQWYAVVKKKMASLSDSRKFRGWDNDSPLPSCTIVVGKSNPATPHTHHPAQPHVTRIIKESESELSLPIPTPTPQPWMFAACAVVLKSS